MQDATHGNSLSHRSLGSTGQCQDPGRVFKGKKMAGQLGNKKVTIQNLIIVKVMTEENILLVKGSIPGFKGANVIVKHTDKKYTPKPILNQELKEEPQQKTKTKTHKEDSENKETKPAENKETKPAENKETKPEK